MPVATRVVSEIATAIGLVPLVWLAVRTVQGKRFDLAWWWLAAAFGVSWVADMTALWADPDFVGNLYPVTQAALVGVVFLDRREAALFAGALVLVAVVALLWRGPFGVDVLLRTVAWLGVVGLVVDRPALGRLRDALIVAFGICLLVWWSYAAWPGWWSWGAYQVVRALGTALFCGAASAPPSRLAVLRRAP